MDIKKNNLIILRGPSCSGKTTAAKTLFSMATGKTALIQQDYYREMFNHSGGGSKSNSEVIHRMIEHNTIAVLESAYNVILEGILSVKSYQKIVDRIIECHSGKSYIFYFDVSIEETIRRRNTKEGNLSYGADELRAWYPSAHQSNHELEILIPESFTADETVKFIAEMIEIKNGVTV